jgi:hypothetical protein
VWGSLTSNRGYHPLDADSTPGYRSLNPPDSGGSLTVNYTGTHHSSDDPRTKEETLVPAPPGQEIGLARLPAPAFPPASSAPPGWRPLVVSQPLSMAALLLNML